MFLKQMNEQMDHRIIGGSEYGWSCFPNGRILDYESDYAYVSTIFDTATGLVYEATVTFKEDPTPNAKPYRWLDPDFKQALVDEAKSRNIDPDNAWDDIQWYDLETEVDFLEKAGAIFNGLPYDTRVEVQVELSDDLILQLAMQAHKRDITMNQMVEIILQNAIDLAKHEEYHDH